MIQQWIGFAQQTAYRRHVVFLEDYDIALAQELVQGVDVWINTPRRPWEACGTSGMKVLVNGGLNCSIPDGWWNEAYASDVGWSIGDGLGGPVEEVDARDALSLYEVLEDKIIPEFYDRDGEGLPRAWLRRVRDSMCKLTPLFGSARMMQDYVRNIYLPLARAVKTRSNDNYAPARDMNGWSRNLYSRWAGLQIGNPTINRTDATSYLAVPIFLGEISPAFVRVELFADAKAELAPEVIMLHQDHAIPGATNGYIYAGSITTSRPAEDYTARVVAHHPEAFLPAELPLIAWQR